VSGGASGQTMTMPCRWERMCEQGAREVGMVVGRTCGSWEEQRARCQHALNLEHSGSAVRCLVTRAAPTNLALWPNARLCFREPPARAIGIGGAPTAWKNGGRPLQIKYRTNEIPNCTPAIEHLRPTAICGPSIGLFLICYKCSHSEASSTSAGRPAEPAVFAPISPS
jgi:hypothetical protein